MINISLKFVQCPHHVLKLSRQRKSCCVCMGKFTDSCCWMNSSCLCCWTLQHTTVDTATQWGIECLVQRWNVRLPLLSKQYYLKLRSFRCNKRPAKLKKKKLPKLLCFMMSRGGLFHQSRPGLVVRLSLIIRNPIARELATYTYYGFDWNLTCRATSASD